MTTTMLTALATLDATSTGKMPYERGHKGWNIKSVQALIERGVLVVCEEREVHTHNGHTYSVAMVKRA